MSEEVSYRWIAVVHTWFVNSKGFYVYELDSKTSREADMEDALLYRKYNGDFREAEIKLIKLQKGEHLPKPPKPGRKLSLWERISGRVDCK